MNNIWRASTYQPNNPPSLRQSPGFHDWEYLNLRIFLLPSSQACKDTNAYARNCRQCLSQAMRVIAYATSEWGVRAGY